MGATDAQVVEWAEYGDDGLFGAEISFVANVTQNSIRLTLDCIAAAELEDGAPVTIAVNDDLQILVNGVPRGSKAHSSVRCGRSGAWIAAPMILPIFCAKNGMDADVLLDGVRQRGRGPRVVRFHADVAPGCVLLTFIGDGEEVED